MKITEIDWTDGKKYKANGLVYKVVKSNKYGTELVRDSGGYLTNHLALMDIINLDFTEVIDLSKIAVDTPIWVSQSNHTGGYWVKAHYCRTDNKGRIIVWHNGKTSHTTTETSPWHYASLTDPNKK